MNLKVIQTNIQLVASDGHLALKEGILIQGEGLCAIYTDNYFDFVCTSLEELNHILAIQDLKMEEVKGTRHCSYCEKPMQEGFYFESDNTQYCSESCLTSVISWEDYLEIYDDGNGDAYWTRWEE